MPSFIPPFNNNNINTGVASMYVQPYNVASPPALPADTVTLGTVWSAPWVSLGASDSGLQFMFSRKTNNIKIEEQVVQVDVATTDLTFSMDVTLAEDTLATMQLAYGGGTVTTTAAASGVPGTRSLVISTDLSTFSFGFEVKQENGFWRRYLIPKVKSVGNIKTVFSRAKDKRMYAVSFESLVAPEQVTVREQFAAALP
jgi:hypothetical protein